MAVENNLAYYHVTTIIAIKKYIEQAPVVINILSQK